MAISGYILKNREEYSLDKIKNDIRVVTSKLNMHISEGKIHTKADGKFSYMQIGIYDDIAFNIDSEDWGNEEVEQGQSLSFYIYSIDEKYESDKAFDWIKEAGKLHKIIYFDDIEYKEELVFKFIYEYLKLNHNDYFWNINNWSYTLNDMEKVNKPPFDKKWCYKNPKMFENLN